MDRFWSKVGKSGDCWNWTAGKFKDGYGKFWLNGRNRYANRVSWELANGAIPDGLCVLHSCDNPSCVRPDHLFLGTPIDNRRDCMAKGREARGPRHGTHTKPHTVPRGERHPLAKLTYEIANKIRDEYDAGEPQTAIAFRYGVVQSCVSSIVRGKTWVRKEFVNV